MDRPAGGLTAALLGLEVVRVQRVVVLVVLGVAGLVIAPASRAATGIGGRILSARSPTRWVLIDPASGHRRAVHIGRPESGGDLLFRAPGGGRLVEVQYAGSPGPSSSRLRFTDLRSGSQSLSPPLEGVLHGAAMARDGRRLAGGFGSPFYVGRSGGDGDDGLAVYDLFTGARTVLARWAAVQLPPLGGLPRLPYNPDVVAGLEWSPDDQRLAFVHTHFWRQAGAPADDVPYDELVTVAPDGSAPIVVARNVAGSLDWSPDGRWIAFVSRSYGVSVNNGPTPRRIEIIGADGTGRRTIYAGSGFAPVWSHSGRYLAFGTEPSSGGFANGALIFDMRSGTAKRVRLQMGAGGRTPWGIAWAPDRDLLAACGREGLFLVRPDGTRKRRLGPWPLCPIFWEPGKSTIT